MLGMLIAASIVGIIVFVSLVVLPVAFVKLPQSYASIFVRKLFPVYHIFLFVLTEVAGLTASTPHLKPLAFISGFVFALHFIFLTPAINKATDLGLTSRFKLLHQLSVVLHLVVISMLTLGLYIDASLF